MASLRITLCPASLMFGSMSVSMSLTVTADARFKVTIGSCQDYRCHCVIDSCSAERLQHTDLNTALDRI